MSAEGKFQAKYSDCLENFKELSYDDKTQNRAVKAFQRPLIKSDCCRLI
jgi:hypothetical protein